MLYLKRTFCLIAIFAIALALFAAGCDKKSTDSEEDNLYSVEFNLTMPSDEEQFVNKPVVVVLWGEDWHDETVYGADTSTISDNLTAVLTIDNIEEGIYLLHVAVYPDSIMPGYGLTEGTAFWLGIEVNINQDMNINVNEDYWQWHSEPFMGVGIKGIPSGNDGELIAVALLVEGSNLMDIFDDENFLMGGLGIIFNNAVFVTLSPDDEEPGLIAQLPSGIYDLMAIVDRDGMVGDYDNDTTYYIPYDVGEPFWDTEFIFDEENYEDYTQLLTGSFSDMVGISGSVTCPEWISGGGDIYILAFDTHPFGETDEGMFASVDIITQPGAYSMPYLPGDTAYVVGVWDANDSGIMGESAGEDGPDLGDYVGIYGGSIDSMNVVICGSQGTNNINFDIDIPWHDSLDSSGE